MRYDEEEEFSPIHGDMNFSVLEKSLSSSPRETLIGEIGVYTESIRTWIDQVHRITRTLYHPHKKNLSQRLMFWNDDEPPSVISSNTVIPMDVGVTSEFEDSLQHLTRCLIAASRSQNYEYEIPLIVENVARIPNLMKTILLIESEEDRARVFSYAIIKRVMMCKYSIFSHDTEGDDTQSLVSTKHKSWFVDILKANKILLRSKVVDYLEIISDFTVEDFSLNSSSTLQDKISSRLNEEFITQRDELFECIGQSEALMPSMLLLTNSDIERLSTLTVVKRVLNYTLRQPFGSAVVFFDMFFHIFLCLGWRTILGYFVFLRVNHLEEIETRADHFLGYYILDVIGLLSFTYFVFRLLLEVLSMLSISFKVFQAHFGNFWGALDVVSVGMVVAAYIKIFFLRDFDLLDKSYFNWSAILIGLLWMKLLGFVKILNWELATFILVIGQILKDIRVFLGVLVIVTIALGDMLYIVLATNEDTCPASLAMTSGGSNLTREMSTTMNYTLFWDIKESVELLEDNLDPNPFCQSQIWSYIGVYRTFLGDFSLDNYSGSLLSTMIFFIMTFFGVIILMNVLIALVDESYEKSTMQSERLFGRARVTYVAKIIAIGELIHPSNTRNNFKNLRCLICSRSAWLRMFVLIFIGKIGYDVTNIIYIATGTGSDELGKYGINHLALTISMSVILPILFTWFVSCSFLVTSGWGDANQSCWCLRRFRTSFFFIYSFQKPVMFITGWILGSFDTDEDTSTPNNTEWRGRLRHVEAVIGRSSTLLKESLTSANVVLEKRLDCHNSTMKAEMKNLEEKLTEMREDMKNFEEKVIEILSKKRTP